MFSLTRVLRTIAISLSVTAAMVAEPTKDSPLGQAGTTPPAVASLDAIDFAGVSTVGNRTMINLYDKQQKRSFWVEAGKPTGDLTVKNYDSAHDQITLKTRGGEKVLPLRPPSAVVNGTAPVAATPALSAAAPTGGTSTPTQSLSQARQEEEARMLVSDLLEIGMAQRKAYEEAQRRATAGLPPQVPPTAAASANSAVPAGSQTAQPAATTTPSS